MLTFARLLWASSRPLLTCFLPVRMRSQIEQCPGIELEVKAMRVFRMLPIGVVAISIVVTLVVHVALPALLNGDETPNAPTGAISAIDVPARTITVQIGDEAKEFEFSKKTKITLDGKDASADQLHAGQVVTLHVSDTADVVTSIEAKQGDSKFTSVKGKVVSVDVVARLIRIATGKPDEDEMEVSRKAKIAFAGKPGTLDDLVVGQFVTLEVASDVEVVTAISADAPEVVAKSPARKSNAQLRIVIDMFGSGDGKLLLGRPDEVPDDESKGKPAKLPFLPHATTVLRSDGLYSFTYDLRKVRSINELMRPLWGDIRLDNHRGAVLLIPKTVQGASGHSEAVCWMTCRLGLPFRILLDIDQCHPNEIFGLDVNRDPIETYHPHDIFTFTPLDGAKLQIIARTHTQPGTPKDSYTLIPQQEAVLSPPTNIPFRLPQNGFWADTKCHITISKNGSMPLSISRWSVSAPIFPETSGGGQKPRSE